MPAPVRLLGDDALVRAARGGSDDAFAEIVRRHAPRLLRQCRRVVGLDRADDALQQTLASALVALRRPRDDRAIELDRWLARIARNASIDLLRRSTPDWDPLDERIDGVRRPPQIAADRETLRRTVADLQDLPERQRRAIVLHAFEGRSWAEIAGELDVGEPAVRQLLHRARTRLRAAAAGLIGPFWLLRPAGARAAGLLLGAGGGGLKAAAGVTVALVVAGGAAVEVASPPHQRRIASALALADAGAATPSRGRQVVVDDGVTPAAGSSVRPRAAGHRRPALRRAHRHVVTHHAQVTDPAPAPDRHPASPAPGSPAHPRSVQAPRHAVDQPAPEPAPTVHPVPVSPAPVSEPSPAPAATPAPASDPAPAPAPAGPPAPPAIGHIVLWQPGPGAGGNLRIEGLPTGNESARVIEATEITCVHAEHDVVVSSGPCTSAEIAVGGQVSIADRVYSVAAGGLVWTRLQLLR